MKKELIQAEGRSEGLRVWLGDWRLAPEGWVACRWPEEVIELLKTGRVVEMSLDHDLSNCDYSERTGYDVLKWVEKRVAGLALEWLPEIHIHSSNPSAALRMQAAVKSIKILWDRNQKKQDIGGPLCDEILICKVCKRGHFRRDTERYVYHSSIGVVCRHHPGVEQWYQALLEKASSELRHSGVITEDYNPSEWRK